MEFVHKKGVLGLDTVRAVIVTLLVIAVTAIAVFLALVSLQNASIFTSGSQADNDTTNIINNITTGTTDFFSNVPTFMTLLGVVVILLIIVLVLIAIRRFESPASGSL